MSCGVGRRGTLDPVWLGLWQRPVAPVLIRLLPWEPPHTAGAALERHTHRKNRCLWTRLSGSRLCPAGKASSTTSLPALGREGAYQLSSHRSPRDSQEPRPHSFFFFSPTTFLTNNTLLWRHSLYTLSMNRWSQVWLINIVSSSRLTFPLLMVSFAAQKFFSFFFFFFFFFYSHPCSTWKFLD